jgi:biopolymer transport protein ExbD
MRMRRHVQEQHESSHGIDLAPMLDFVLNLLIFFIITAIFVKESGLLVNRPTSFEQSDEKSESITIEILDTGEIFVDTRLVDARAVRANVERLHAVNPSSGVLILADEGAPTGTVVEVVDQVHLGGIWNITFSTAE